MKKLLVLIMLIFLSSASFANPLFDLFKGAFDKNDSWCYIESRKITNGGYEWKIPSVEYSYQNGLFVFEPEIALMFTSPRNKMMDLNHHSIRTNFNFGVQALDSFATFGVGLDYYISGNADKIPEGFSLSNTLRVGIKW